MEVKDPDVALMLAFQAGDESAFIKLYEKYRDRVVNFTRRFLTSQAQGEEAAQDVFLKLYQAAPRYKPGGRFSTYLYRIATNHCLNLVSRHDHKRVDRGTELGERSEALMEDDGVTPEAALGAQQMKEAVHKAMGNLADNQRAALLLCHYQGLSYKEAAEVIEVSEGAVKSLIHRAREKLAKDLLHLKADRQES